MTTDRDKPPTQIHPDPETYPQRTLGTVTDVDFGKTILGILQRASFPGESSETVTELKQICRQIEAGRYVLCQKPA